MHGFAAQSKNDVKIRREVTIRACLNFFILLPHLVEQRSLAVLLPNQEFLIERRGDSNQGDRAIRVLARRDLDAPLPTSIEQGCGASLLDGDLTGRGQAGWRTTKNS